MANRLFSIPVPATAPEQARASAGDSATGGDAPSQPSVGVISAQQSALTFAGAPAAVTLVCKVLGSVMPEWGASRWFPVVLSLLVGMLIYWQGTPPGGTLREKVTGFLFALINSFAIAAAALGLDAASEPAAAG